MNLPPHFQFDLAIAKLGWPLVTRDGRKAEVLKWDARGDKPLSGFVSLPEEDDFTQWYQTGEWAIQKTEYDLHLSANLSDPAVRAAVEAAHKAGEEISWWEPDSDVRQSKNGLFPVWDWGSTFYLPTRLLSQLPQPWTPPPLPDGFELFTPKAGDSARDDWRMCRTGKQVWEDGIGGCVVKQTDLSVFLFARRKWTLPEPPPGQQWHRPEALTEHDWKDGWRPLLVSELDEKRHNDIEFLYGSEWGFADRSAEFTWASKGDALRTRRPLPAPVVYWSAPEHVPGPVCWLRFKTGRENGHSMVGVITPHGVETHKRFYPWREIEQFEHSTDRLNWFPCTLPAQ